MLEERGRESGKLRQKFDKGRNGESGLAKRVEKENGNCFRQKEGDKKG